MPRRHTLALALDTGSAVPLFLQIARAIGGEIRAANLRPGDPLPGSRALARALGVTRNTVLAAYMELAAEGWIVARSGAGSRVAQNLPLRPRSPAPLTRGLAATPGFPLAPLECCEPWCDYPRGTLRLTKGVPDLRLLPLAELARAWRREVLVHGQDLLGLGDPRGHPRLRRAIAAMLAAARGIHAPLDGIMITRGSQFALDLVARAALAPGDAVAIESLGHPAPRAALRRTGARLLPVPVDGDGMRVDLLADLARREPIRAVYLTPHHQFPTTVVMPLARRLALLELARERRMAVIEDDYDHEFHYDGRPVLPLASGDPAGVVVYVGTLSKILAPGLRIGFVAAPPPVIERMMALRVATDIQGDLVTECAVAALFESGELGRHVRRMRRTYHARRDALVTALRRHLSGALDFAVPSGGMALWARVAPGIVIDEWARRGLALGVAFRSGRMYDIAGRDLPNVRLGFAALDERELDEAARRMAAALAAWRREDGARPITPPCAVA